MIALGKGSMIGPMDFHKCLSETTSITNEREKYEDITIDDFVKFGRTIGFALKESVRDFDKKIDPECLKIAETRGIARELIRRFDEFVAAVEKVKALAAKFREEMLPKYNSDLDKVVAGNSLVKSRNDAESKTIQLEGFLARVNELFLTRGHGTILNTSTNLIDRIDTLKVLMASYK